MEIKARAFYTANGSIENFAREQLNIIGARAQTSLNTVVTAETSFDRTTTRFNDGTLRDPLAQTFQVQETEGVIITSVGIFFSEKASDNTPASVQIRPVINGYPDANVIFSEKTLYPQDILVSKDELVETKFTFPNPIHIQGGTEYAIVVLSENNEYKIWISRMGDNILNSPQTVNQQPSTGSLFKSQNSSTWTAEQYEDMAFVLYKARFDITKNADVAFVNNTIPERRLPTNAFYAKAGLTKVRVHHPENGFFNNDIVQFRGLDDGNGHVFSGGELVTTVSDVEFDSYVIDLPTTATYTGPFGGAGIVASANIRYNKIVPNIEIRSFPSTDFSITLKPTLPGYLQTQQYTALNRSEVEFNQSFFIASPRNEEANLDGSKSFTLRTTMTTTNPDLSPMLNKTHSSLIMSQYKINSPTYDELNDDVIDNIDLTADTDVVEFDYNENDPQSSGLEI